MTTSHATAHETRVYYGKLASEPGKFIAVKHGETCYHATTVYTQDHADRLNEIQGIADHEVQAAMLCSMFDNWPRFDSMVETLTAAHQRALDQVMTP